MGPALTILFNDLDGRKDKQTLFEQRLYGELLALKAFTAERLPDDPVVHPLDPRGFPNLTHGVGGAFEGNFAGVAGPRRDRNFAGVVIGPNPDDDFVPVRMQVNCGKADCPNKEYK